MLGAQWYVNTHLLSQHSRVAEKYYSTIFLIKAWGQEVRTDVHKHINWRNSPCFASYYAICSLEGPLSPPHHIFFFLIETI